MSIFTNVARKAVVIPVIVLLTFPLLAGADVTPPVAPAEPTIIQLEDISTIVTRIFTWIYGLFYVVAAIFIIVAAFYYLTAQGEPEKVKKAKSMLIYAIVAIVIALLSTILAGFISDLLTPV